MSAQPQPTTAHRQLDKRIAILGAGAAGVCAAKYMLGAGFTNVTVFEIGSQIGGMWCYENDNGLSSAYRTLHINTSRNVTRFHDFAFAPDVQLFPDHSDMHKYLADYASHFGVRDIIRFNTPVKQVRPEFDADTANPRWLLELGDGSAEVYDTVIAATGHLAKPNHVDAFKSEFSGQYLHSHYYREPAPFVGKRICIVGVGNSALDISGDVCATAERCVVVARSGALIMPKLLCGIPGTEITMAIQRPWLPDWMRRRLLRLFAYIVHGDQTKLGFKPLADKRTHATSNGTIITDVTYRRVEIKHEIERIDGQQIFFSDGSSGVFDVLIAATGYLIDLPFMPPAVVPLTDNQLNLYKRIVPPGWPGLYFVGFFNTDTALNMVFEHQARWVRDIELGMAQLPDESAMHDDIAHKNDWVARYYKASGRHTIEEEHVPYLKELASSARRMRARAAK